MTTILTARRRFLGTSGVLSATALSLMAGRPALARGMTDDPAQDAAILNVALALEHEAIAAYQLGAESGLLQKPVLAVAVLFQGHHKAHRDALAAAVRKLGGQPVAERSAGEYAKALNAGSLKNQTDVLGLASRLELGAINAYLGVLPRFDSGDLAQVAGRIAADETMHYTVLTQVLGRPLPAAALSFGA